MKHSPDNFENDNPILKGISYPAAKDKAGNLHWASDAPASQPYVCVGCDGAMILRAGRRRRHFAHKPGSHCTAPETALHRLAKLTIADSFRSAVTERRPYPLTFQCKFCRADHERNLVKRATIVKTEAAIERIIPDISIYDHEERLIGAIEVVVTHLPERETEAQYVDMGIPVLLVFPNWPTVEELRERVRADAIVNMSSLCPEWLRHLRELEHQEQLSREAVPPEFGRDLSRSASVSP